MNTAEIPWSLKVRVEDIPEGGRHFVLSADTATRAAVANVVGLVELPRLEAQFEVRRHGRAGLKLQGTVSASVVQSCVVTLNPVENEVSEEVEVVFSPDAADPRPESEPVDVDAAIVEPELVVGGAIDLGAIAVEFLVLGLDPYPRRPDAAFEAPAAEDRGDSPFAALAALRQTPGQEKG